MTYAMMLTIVLLFVLPLSGRAWVLYLTAALIATVVLYSRPLRHALEMEYTGIAPFSPRIESYTVIVVVFASCILLRRGRLPGTAAVFAPFFVLMSIGMISTWAGSSYQWAGWQCYGLGFVAVICGAYAGGVFMTNAAQTHAFVVFVTALVSLELIVCVLQLSGYPLFPIDVRSVEFVAGRANGTTNHPNTLGKLVQLMLICVLPFTRTREDRTRRVASLFVVLAVLTTVLTGGRAVTVGVVSTVLIWYLLLSRSQRASRRLTVPVAGLACALPFLSTIVDRIQEGPSDSRSRLSDVATEFVIPHNWWFGVGPNSYLHYVQVKNLDFGSALPVHDAFLLSLAELGAVVSLLLWGGVVYTIIRAWKRRGLEGAVGHSAKALLAGVPGLFIIALTGWGLIAGGVLVMFMFTLGFAVPDRQGRRVPGLRKRRHSAHEDVRPRTNPAAAG